MSSDRNDQDYSLLFFWGVPGTGWDVPGSGWSGPSAYKAEQGDSVQVPSRSGQTIFYVHGDIGQGNILFEPKSPKIEEKNVAAPPGIAEFCLALFLSKAKTDGIIGDLSEQFNRDCQRFGEPRARRIYYAQALKSMWPLLRRATIRLIKWAAIAEAVRRRFF